MQEPIRVALSLIGIVIIIAAAYFVTYYIGLKASGQNRGGIRSRGRGRGRGRSINLLERFAISRDKSFCIVEIAGKIYFIGVTNQSMTLLDTLDSAEYMGNGSESNAVGAQNIVPGGPFSGKYVNKLASFMARKMGKEQGTGGNAGARDREDGMFADAMTTARNKDTSGQPAREKADKPDSSEEKK